MEGIGWQRTAGKVTGVWAQVWTAVWAQVGTGLGLRTGRGTGTGRRELAGGAAAPLCPRSDLCGPRRRHRRQSALGAAPPLLHPRPSRPQPPRDGAQAAMCLGVWIRAQVRVWVGAEICPACPRPRPWGWVSSAAWPLGRRRMQGGTVQQPPAVAIRRMSGCGAHCLVQARPWRIRGVGVGRAAAVRRWSVVHRPCMNVLQAMCHHEVAQGVVRLGRHPPLGL